LALVKDASAFVRYFGMAMARSAPHIYVSALPFTPTSSQILNQYLYQFPRTLALERGQLSHWPALQMVIPTHDSSVSCVVFSPDGQRIASASDDRTIRVWDATTGQVVADPFIRLAFSVTSIAYSLDGQHIASTSGDGKIRMWDATTRQVVVGPFTENTFWIHSIAYSPDGQRIASLSKGIIRMWDVAGPFTRHTYPVTSVAFSPDWQHTASASEDGAIDVMKIMTEDIKDHFTDQTMINSDGLIYGEENELVLWIPGFHRPCLHRPSTIWIAGEHETRLDFSKFVYGSNWATVHDHNSSK
jgi:WD40 repeat protein